MKDTLQRFIFENASVRGELVQLEESFQTITQQHPYPDVLRRVLGEALCAAVLLSAIIKFNGRLTVQFQGKGKLQMLIAQCDNEFHLRALAKWKGELTQAETVEALKQGILMIIVDTGNGKSYQGIVSWHGDSLAKSIEAYFRDSEQLATKLWLSVNDQTAAGLLLQFIPNTEDKNREQIVSAQEESLKHFVDITEEKLREADLLHLDPVPLLNELYPHEQVRVFRSVPVSFQCTCTLKRSEQAILLLGREEAEAELKGNHQIVVTCDFCNTEYLFDAVDIAAIFQSQPQTNTRLH